ncbi:hypothetical protein [Labilibaculum manganireducens]|nr:hypothetical protein [Labilibaculum manganireducens]
MNTIKLTELTVRELEDVKGGIHDRDASPDDHCLCNGNDIDGCIKSADA